MAWTCEKPMAYIVLADSDHEIDRRELVGPVVIGRALDCSLAVHDALLSRRHCSLERFANEWVVKDLASKNGTFVNNQLIQSHLLRDGDIVRFGKTRLFFRTGEFVPATDQQGVSKLLRPLDPREAMAATMSGFKYFEDDDTPLDQEVLDTFPRPQPKPVEPKSLTSPQMQVMLMDMASSAWEALDQDLPRRISGNPLPSPKIDGIPTLTTSQGLTMFNPDRKPSRIEQVRKQALRISLACAIGSTIVALWAVSWHL